MADQSDTRDTTLSSDPLQLRETDEQRAKHEPQPELPVLVETAQDPTADTDAEVEVKAEAQVDEAGLQLHQPEETAIELQPEISQVEPEAEAPTAWEEYCVTEARIELSQSHALLTFGSLIESLEEGFSHTCFGQEEETWLFDEYSNDCFLVTYCINMNGRDELRVRWIDPIAEEAHNDGELPALARHLARSLGGGTNLHLLDRTVRVPKYD